MKQSIKGLADLFLLLIIAVLAALLLLPRAKERLSFNYQPVPNYSMKNQDQEQKTQEQLAKPREIAVLFGWREKTGQGTIEKTVEVVADDPIEEATWLKPMGFVSGQDGARNYLFKESKTGKVLTLASGVESKGWKLLEVTPEGFLLEFQGKEYIIKQNE